MSGTETEVNIEELRRAFQETFQSPGCTVINEDIADDPVFIKFIKDRLGNVGNHPFGDISAGLQSQPNLTKEEEELIHRTAEAVLDSIP